MARYKERIDARKLRTQGMSIKFIAEKLGVAKSTVSIWCSDVVLTKSQKDQLKRNMISAGHKGRMIGAYINKKKKEEKIKKFRKSGLEEVSELSFRDLMILGTALYWAEGSKKGRGSFSFVNSDSQMILIIVKWLKTIFSIEKSDLMPRVVINQIHENRLDEILKFWSNLLELPLDQFQKTFFIKSKQKKVYDDFESYFGTLVLRVRRSTDLRYRILGLIEGLKMSG